MWFTAEKRLRASALMTYNATFFTRAAPRDVLLLTFPVNVMCYYLLVGVCIFRQTNKIIFKFQTAFPCTSDFFFFFFFVGDVITMGLQRVVSRRYNVVQLRTQDFLKGYKRSMATLHLILTGRQNKAYAR